MNPTGEDKWAVLRDLAELSAFSCLIDLDSRQEVTPRIRARFGDVIEMIAPHTGTFVPVFFARQTGGEPIRMLGGVDAALALAPPQMTPANAGEMIRIYFGDSIVAAAIKYEENILTRPAPAHHRDIAKMFMAEVTADPVLSALFNGAESVYLSVNYGFICASGTFMDKRQAYDLAILSRQLKGYGIKSGELFSEDLW